MMQESPEGINIVVELSVDASDPAFYKALDAYTHLPEAELDGLTIVVHVSGYASDEESPVYAQVAQFKKKHPSINLIFSNEFNASSGPKQGRETIVVRHDSSLRAIQRGYFDAIRRHFSDEAVEMVAGFVDYPQEAFHQDHLFLAMQIFEDLLEKAMQTRNEKVVARNNNVAFRADEASLPRFHNTRVDINNRPMHLSPVSGARKVRLDDELMVVTVSARKQLELLGKKRDLVSRFGYSPDLDHEPSAANKVTSKEFSGRFEHQINALLEQVMSHGATQRELHFMVLDVLREMGVEAKFSAGKVQITDFSGLKARIARDWIAF